MEGPLKIDPRTDVTSAFLHMDKVEGAGFYSLLAFLSCNWEDGWESHWDEELDTPAPGWCYEMPVSGFPLWRHSKKTII